MGAAAAIMPMVLGSVLSAAMSGVLSPKVDKPGAAGPPPTADPKEADKAARDAQKKQREAAAAAMGRTDTILAGGELGSAQSTGNAQVKTLLGR